MDCLTLNENSCRICLKYKVKLNWNEEIFEFCGISYKDCYYKYTQLTKFDSDCYTTDLCETCANELKNAHMLFEKALESFNILQAVLRTRQIEAKHSHTDICHSLPAMKYEIQTVDNVNGPIDDKRLIEIGDQICLPPECDSEGVSVQERTINDCEHIVMNEDVTVQHRHFIDIQHLESSVEIPMQQHLNEISNPEVRKSSDAKRTRNKIKKYESVTDSSLKKLKEYTNKAVKKIKKSRSLPKTSLKQQFNKCSNTKLPEPLVSKKIDNKVEKVALTVTLEQNLDESCDTKSVPPTTKPKKARQKRLLMCAYCSLKVNGRSKLLIHEATHSENRKRTETCPECGVKLYTKLALTEHIKTHDGNRQKNYKCEFCENAFFNRGSLNVHRRIHLGLMLKCQLCTKEFFRQVDLDRHLLKHSASPLQRYVGKKKYTVQCQYCNKSVLTDKWKGHVAVHLNQPQVKCKICDKKFFSRSNCTNHLRRFHLKNSNEYESFIHYYGDRKTRVSILMMKQQLSAQPLTENL